MFLPASLQSSIMEMLDREIEAQLRCWHQNPDMMYSIHPIDGSFLIWYMYTLFYSILSHLYMKLIIKNKMQDPSVQ